MGLTSKSTGISLLDAIGKKSDYNISITLSGNPNVGKSSIFNHLTGDKQHTGNWTGKTVEAACGEYSFRGKRVLVTDLPGCYSLNAASADEEVAKNGIIRGSDINIVVCDAGVLERSLTLFFAIARVAKKVILCLNLTDEAAKNGITVNSRRLAELLGVSVIVTEGNKGKGLLELKEAINKTADLIPTNKYYSLKSEAADEYFRLSEQICSEVVCHRPTKRSKMQLKADKIICSKRFGIPIMLGLFLLLFWITVSGANYPSRMLSAAFTSLEAPLYRLLTLFRLPQFLCDLTVFGIYRTVGFIVAVMLPPMSIFFPLFSLLEDIGLLPRIAFNTDRAFAKCKSCGKQCLTMCMGLGCNAAGVVGCRIIASRRERLIAILTNSFIPCNGRFPTLIAVIGMFFITSAGVFSGLASAVIMCCLLMLSISITFAVSFVLSKTVLKGEASPLLLELPPYRRPQLLRTLWHSVSDRILFVLSRALITAIPAGAVIFLAANLHISNISLLAYASNFLEPIGRAFGLDGVILLAFILGLPANETVMPIMLLCYINSSVFSDIASTAVLKDVFIANGWSALTALNVLLMCLFHSPCATTLLTIKKETGSIKYTALAAVLPTAIGCGLCAATTLIYKLFF